MIKLFLVISMVFSYPALAHNEGDHPHADGESCSGRLTPKYSLVTTGRTPEGAKRYDKILKEILGPGGIATQLGMRLADQIHEVVQGPTLGALVALNRFPVGHWYDGAQVTGSMAQSSVLEFVTPGNMVRHAYYRDDLPIEQNISIILHVLGHVHFGTHMRFAQTRASESVQDSYSMHKYMEYLYDTYDHAEVREWYQYLLSLQNFQDFRNSTVETPEELAVKPEDRFRLGMARPYGSQPETPSFKETPNVMQSLIGNLPPGTPEWKIELAKRFEKLNRYAPGAVKTKYMNEGWASLMQELILPYTSSNNMAHYVDYCCLAAGVFHPNLTSPYYLGREAWRNIRNAFNARFEIKSLPRIEQDKAFIEYAVTEIISKMEDRDFLALGLTDAWIVKHQLAITRPVQGEEWDFNLQPSKNPEDQYQYIVVTKDPKKVRQAIIENARNWDIYFPRVHLESLSDPSSGEVRLSMKDKLGREFPLDKRSLVQTLLVLSRIMRVPVSLESTFIDEGQTDSPKRVRVVVTPDGNVKAFEVFRADGKNPGDKGTSHPENVSDDLLFEKGPFRITEEPYENETEEMKLYVQDFIENLDLGKVRNISPFTTRLEKQIQADIRARIEKVPLVSLYQHAPTVPRALEELSMMLSNRTLLALKRAMKNPGQLQRRANGIRIKALPDIPQLSFDYQKVQEILNTRAVQPVDAVADFMKIIDEASRWRPGGGVRRIGDEPGRRIWGPDPNKKQGDGDGDGEGDEDGPPGNGGHDVTWADVSLEAYAKALGDEVQLPFLRPLDGVSRMKDEAKGGRRVRRTGTAIYSEIMQRAMKRGIEQHIIKELEEQNAEDDNTALTQEQIRKIDLEKFLKERKAIYQNGIRHILPQVDWIVRSSEPKKTPDINAVIVFVVDFSGSMGEELLKLAKKAAYDLRAILTNKYKNVEFRFVGFDGTPHVFKDLNEFIRAELGGGTSYTEGFKKTGDVLEEFSPSQYDRFVVGLGDLEDFAGPEGKAALDRVRMLTRYMGMVKTSYGEGAAFGEWEPLFKKLHDSDQFFGYYDLDVQKYTPTIFKKLFKNPEK